MQLAVTLKIFVGGPHLKPKVINVACFEISPKEKVVLVETRLANNFEDQKKPSGNPGRNWINHGFPTTALGTTAAHQKNHIINANPAKLSL